MPVYHWKVAGIPLVVRVPQFENHDLDANEQFILLSFLYFQLITFHN
jgi:hypothetical protein